MTEQEYRKAMINQLTWIFWALIALGIGIGGWLSLINTNIDNISLSSPSFPDRIIVSTEQEWGRFKGGPLKVQMVEPPTVESEDDQ